MQPNQSEINRKAWSYKAYEFWLQKSGPPSEAAAKMKQDPAAMLHHLEFMGDVKGKKIANLLGSNGRKAIPLALLGAEVTVVDISTENERYAIELAQAAGVEINYIVSDVNNLDLEQIKNSFDIVYLEGGILHYFNDLDRLALIIHTILNEKGRLVLNDFHPFRKIVQTHDNKLVLEGDYFDTNLKLADIAYKPYFPIAEQPDFPDCYLRYWTIGEIITAFAQAGFIIEQLIEEPGYNSFKHIPGLFTLVAKK